MRTGWKARPPSGEMRRGAIIEALDKENAVDEGNGRHSGYEVRTRRTASFQPV